MIPGNHRVVSGFVHEHDNRFALHERREDLSMRRIAAVEEKDRPVFLKRFLIGADFCVADLPGRGDLAFVDPIRRFSIVGVYVVGPYDRERNRFKVLCADGQDCRGEKNNGENNREYSIFHKISFLV